MRDYIRYRFKYDLELAGTVLILGMPLWTFLLGIWVGGLINA